VGGDGRGDPEALEGSASTGQKLGTVGSDAGRRHTKHDVTFEHQLIAQCIVQERRLGVIAKGVKNAWICPPLVVILLYFP